MSPSGVWWSRSPDLVLPSLPVSYLLVSFGASHR